MLDLCAGVSPEGAWTVTQLTRRARAVVEAGLAPLWVRGEVSGFKAWQSGHWYFALRDRTAQLRCVMFQKDNRRLPTPPADGMQVFVFARPTMWEEKGEFRLTVLDVLSTEAGGLWQGGVGEGKAALPEGGGLGPGRPRPPRPPKPRPRTRSKSWPTWSTSARGWRAVSRHARDGWRSASIAASIA